MADAGDTEPVSNQQTSGELGDLTFSDYIALIIAMAQTVLLPFILASAALLALFLLSLLL